jgi:hypothetical protein
VYFLNPATAEFYTYTAATYGGHVAFGHLCDAITAMGMLRGAPAVPLINFAEKPFKTKRGMKTRPHFAIVDWKTPGNGAALPPAPPPLQLTNEIPAPSPEPAAPKPAAAAKPAPAAETSSPRGKMTVVSGKKKSLTGAVFNEIEARRPDLKPGPDLSDDIPF